MHRIIYILTIIMLVAACKDKPATTSENGAFRKAEKVEGDNVNRIVDSGELIVGTISGPDTYFEFQERGFGLQYALVSDFAETLGVGVRMEMASDTLQLIEMLEKGDIDLVALQIPQDHFQKKDILTAGATSKDRSGEACSWRVKSDMPDLAEALDDWFSKGVELKIEKLETQRIKKRSQVRRQVHAPFISIEKGVISTYDNLFKKAATVVGWDWKLIAAQCYQESAFDPNAVSWAGASGLMQLMPQTAARMGLAEENLFKPAENIAAASRYLATLQKQFSSVPNAEERTKFILAAYNAGPGHIQDAQALARKHGRNANSWNDVSYYVRALSSPQYYRDPVVRHGYMIGNETYNYVLSIIERWKAYGGRVGTMTDRATTPSSSPSASSEATHSHKRNRFTRDVKILSPEELQKQ